MSTRELIDAIESGDSVAIQTSFEHAMASRIADRMDTMRQSIAQGMFRTAQEMSEIEEDVEQIRASEGR
jgi:predicted DNA-binding protein YlxM (UPF0122 family)